MLLVAAIAFLASDCVAEQPKEPLLIWGAWTVAGVFGALLGIVIARQNRRSATFGAVIGSAGMGATMGTLRWVLTLWRSKEPFFEIGYAKEILLAAALGAVLAILLGGIWVVLILRLSRHIR